MTEHNDSMVVTVDYGDVENVEIILEKEVKEPSEEEEIDPFLMITIITVCVTILVLLVLVIFIRRNRETDYEE